MGLGDTEALPANGGAPVLPVLPRSPFRPHGAQGHPLPPTAGLVRGRLCQGLRGGPEAPAAASVLPSPVLGGVRLTSVTGPDRSPGRYSEAQSRRRGAHGWKPSLAHARLPVSGAAGTSGPH